MKLFGRRETRSAVFDESGLDLELREAMSDEVIGVKEALGIPAVAGCVELISSVIADLPIHLYREEGAKVTEVLSDYRLRLLNEETGDLLDAYQWKKALIRDYLLPGGGYSYVDWQSNRVDGIYYIDPMQVSVNLNSDPIYKRAVFLVGGQSYPTWSILRILRNTRDGVSGQGVVVELNQALSVMSESLKYEKNMVKTGGAKGFLKSAKKLTEDAVSKVSAAIKRLFSNQGKPVVLLNSDIDYKSAGQTAVESQLNENKVTNGREVCRIFGLSPKLFEGGATAEDRRISAAQGILPIVGALQSALNRFCLLETEKDSYYFAIDSDGLLQGSVLERYQAYEIAVKNSFMQLDEVRYRDNLSPLGLDYLKFGLDTVLYDPKNKTVYTPNTDKTTVLGKGGDKT